MGRLINALRLKFSKTRYKYLAIAVIVVAVGSLFFYFTEVLPVLAQPSMRQFPEGRAAASGQKVVVFSPHPDDESIAVGGYIAQSIRNGADVRIVQVTNGDAQHQEAGKKQDQ